MFEKIVQIFKKEQKKIATPVVSSKSREAAKERLHLVLMQDRANVSADFLELMKQEIVDVIKKYIDIDEDAIDVRLTNKENENGTNGAPALYANIPLVNVKVEELDEKEEKDNINETEEVVNNLIEEKNKDINAAENNNKENIAEKNIENKVDEDITEPKKNIDNEKKEKNKNRKKKK